MPVLNLSYYLSRRLLGAIICSQRSRTSCIWSSLSREVEYFIQMYLQSSFQVEQINKMGKSEVLAKALAFGLTFLGYASLHALREGWSYSKKQLEKGVGVSEEYLGIVDALYLVSYSLGMAALGSIIHKFSLKNYIAIGLVVASCSYMLFPIIYQLTGFYSEALMTILMCINGFSQATGWPGMMGVFGNWFKKNKKGVIMAIWAMNANVGNIIASSICNVLQNEGYSWFWNFFVTGLFGIAVGVLIFFFLKDKPDEEEEVQQKPLADEEGSVLTQVAAPEEQRAARSLISVICLPRVPLYMIGYSCLKGCIYGLLFWLPIFFANKGGSLADQKGYIASMIDLGSLIGGTIVGFLADRYDRRATFMMPLLFFSSLVMFLVAFALGSTVWTYYAAMFLIGNCIGGPYNIIGTVIAIDIGAQIQQKGSVTKVSSLIEGSAAFFTALSMIIIPRIPFETIFYLFAIECILATIALIPVFLQQMRGQKVQVQQNPLLTNEDEEIQKAK